MKLILPHPILLRLQRDLKRAGRREIGGLLMGEHVSEETFRIADVSVQHGGGSSAHFVRDPAQHAAHLAGFFEENGHDYARFNYLGEWHSHPSFEPLPSGKDIATMQSIVDDPAVGANFLVLLIVRRAGWSRVEVSALGFRRNGDPFTVDLEGEAGDAPTHGVWHRVMKFIWRGLSGRPAS